MSKIISIINSTFAAYHELFYTKADPRIRDKFLMGDPAPIVAIYAVYIIFIKVFLKKFMKNRPPYKLKNFENLLLLILFVFSAYIFVVASKVWIFHYNWRCEAFDKSETEFNLMVVNTSYFFLLSKFFYIFESIILALRKNYTYIEGYLLIHHFFYPIGIWACINYFPTGHATFLGLIHSFAHLLMFGFHLIANNFFKNWKLYKYKSAVNGILLLFQMLTFFPHTAQLFFKNDCNFPIEYPITVFSIIFTAMSLMAVFVVPKAIKFHIQKFRIEQNLHLRQNNSVLSFDLEKFEDDL